MNTLHLINDNSEYYCSAFGLLFDRVRKEWEWDLYICENNDEILAFSPDRNWKLYNRDFEDQWCLLEYIPLNLYVGATFHTSSIKELQSLINNGINKIKAEANKL